jgi:3-oxoadipate enol-lactonase
MPYTEASGIRLAWEERGTGDPLLLIMGATFTRRMWHRAIPALSEHYRVIWFDNRGIGESARTTSPYTIGDLAADAGAVLDAAGVDEAHVYGASMGGLTAQEFALTSPVRVRSLVLACTWAAAPDRRRRGWQSTLRYRIPPGLAVRWSTPVLYGPKRDKRLVQEDLAIVRSDLTPNFELLQQTRAMLAYCSRDRLHALDVPTLVLHGDHDRVIPYRWGQELASLTPGARLVTLEGAGHYYLTGSSDEANDAVLRFLGAAAR